jgi:hypothetical protein
MTSPSNDGLKRFTLTEQQWETLRDGWADISQWHRGFKSANPDYPEPAGIHDAGRVIIDMKEQALTVFNK